MIFTFYFTNFTLHLLYVVQLLVLRTMKMFNMYFNVGILGAEQMIISKYVNFYLKSVQYIALPTFYLNTPALSLILCNLVGTL